MSLSPNLSQCSWFLYNGLHWPPRLLLICMYLDFLVERTEAIFYRLRASRMLTKPIFLKCKTTPVVKLPAIDLHPSAAPLDIASLVITLLWAVASSFSLLPVLILYQHSGILCQPHCDTWVLGGFSCFGTVIKTDNPYPPVHKGKIAPILIVCSLPQGSPRGTNLII